MADDEDRGEPVHPGSHPRRIITSNHVGWFSAIAPRRKILFFSPEMAPHRRRLWASRPPTPLILIAFAVAVTNFITKRPKIHAGGSDEHVRLGCGSFGTAEVGESLLGRIDLPARGRERRGTQFHNQHFLRPPWDFTSSFTPDSSLHLDPTVSVRLRSAYKKEVVIVHTEAGRNTEIINILESFMGMKGGIRGITGGGKAKSSSPSDDISSEDDNTEKDDAKNRGGRRDTEAKMKGREMVGGRGREREEGNEEECLCVVKWFDPSSNLHSL